jgi:hypothetical protein
MQFQAYLSGPLPEKAPHRISHVLALEAVKRGLARKVGLRAIQILSGMSIRELKDYLRGSSGLLERINPPGYHCLPYTYPLPFHILEHYQ